ncbi:MAG TPA: hypothetical protein ENI38_01060 [Candidatus Acetothermia bacterium]|nr:hypothetical protein [Candidatus Acetothermia bacterium]
MRMWGAVLVLLSLLAVIPAWGAGLEMGLGFGLDSEEASTIAALEVFGASQPNGWLTWRFTVCYLPPLLPGEGAAMFTGLEALGSLGEGLRVVLGLGGGAVWEAGLWGPAFNPALSASLGLEFWFGQQFGVYARGSWLTCWRRTPYGRVAYPYLPWSLGILFSTPGLTGHTPSETPPPE